LKLEIGKEYPQPNEGRDIDAMIEMITRRLKRDYAPGHILRQFHAKMHGCVEATFTVDSGISTQLQGGVFVPGKTYSAWIRFSNGNSTVVDDRKRDLRGMAIKLLDVPGDMLTADFVLPQSQDFLLVSYPTLMSATVADFRKNIQAVCGGRMAMLLFAINPLNWASLVRTLQSMKKCDHLFDLQFWSVSPSRLGNRHQAVKYSAVPAMQASIGTPVKRHPDFLRETMQQDLDAREFVFDFRIQMQEDAVTMPIENPCKEWHSAWQRVATIRIPRQHFDTAERNSFGEKLTFNPWHSLAAHQPLGGVSRARRAVYDAISRFRLAHKSQS
jgi:hypothetical protein